MTYRAATTDIPMFSEQDGDRISGAMSILWESLSRRINFSVIPIGEIEYGELYSEKNGSGVFGSLIRNESDFSIVPLAITKEAVDWLDFSAVMGYDYFSFISGPPRKFRTNYFSSLASFQKSLWELLFAALWLYSMFWALIKQFLRKGRAPSVAAFLDEFGNYFFTSAMVLVNQFRLHVVKSDKLYERLCWISWRIAAMCLSLSFTGIFLAKLAKKDDPLRYEELNDVYLDENMKLFLMENTPPYHDIKTSEDNLKRNIWKRVTNDETDISFKNLDILEISTELMDGKLVAIMSRKGFLSIMTFICGSFTEFYISKEPYMSIHYALFMRKGLNTEVKNEIKFVAGQIESSHIMQARVKCMVSLGQMCLKSGPSTPSDRPLQIENFYFILVICLFTTGFALCSIFVEILLPPSKSLLRKQVKRKRIWQLQTKIYTTNQQNLEYIVNWKSTALEINLDEVFFSQNNKFNQ